jgi:glycosyltransferase involved in cell wall biosynthesis
LDGSPLHQRLKRLGVPCEALTARRGSPALAWQLRSVIKRGGYGVVDAHNVQSIFWGHLAARLAGVRGCVATIHSDYGAEYPNLKGVFYESVLRLNRLFAREYITVTETLQRKAERQRLGERATLIHNAVPIPPLPLPPPDPALRTAWRAAPDDFVIGSVARLKPVKGHRYLLEAMAHVRDLPVRLVIVGDGPLRAELEAQAAALGVAERVHFAGFCEDVPRLLPSLDCLCMASALRGVAIRRAGSGFLRASIAVYSCRRLGDAAPRRRDGAPCAGAGFGGAGGGHSRAGERPRARASWA